MEKIKCKRGLCANNEDGECKLAKPNLVRREEIDAYVNCLDQKNK